MPWSVPEIWKGGDCWILAGGPSLAKEFDIPSALFHDVCQGRKQTAAFRPYLEVLKDQHVIAVNNSYQLGRWVDFIFFGDNAWYLVHEERILKHPALIVTCAPRFQGKNLAKIKYLSRHSKTRGLVITDKRNSICWNYNSGAAAINLAVLLGAKRIYLIGFDMRTMDSQTHWHGGHGAKRLPPFEKHLKGFPKIAEDARKLGTMIYNCSTSSAIRDFPFASAKDFF